MAVFTLNSYRSGHVDLIKSCLNLPSMERRKKLLTTAMYRTLRALPFRCATLNPHGAELAHTTGVSILTAVFRAKGSSFVFERHFSLKFQLPSDREKGSKYSLAFSSIDIMLLTSGNDQANKHSYSVTPALFLKHHIWSADANTDLTA